MRNVTYLLLGFLLMNSVYCIQRVGIQPHANPSHLLMASFIGLIFFLNVMFLFVLIFILGANPDPEVSGVEGGTPCAACTGVVALIEQLAYIHDEVAYFFIFFFFGSINFWFICSLF